MFINAVSVETQITPKMRASLEVKESSGLARFILETLKPKFEIETDFGAYDLSPYGEPDPDVRVAVSVISLFLFFILLKRML